MKVTQNTPDLLVLDHVPWLMGVGMIFMIVTFLGIGIFLILDETWPGLIFAAFSLVPLLFLVKFTARVQVIFDRPGDLVTLRRRDFMGFSEDHVPLSSIDHAKIERQESRDSDGDRSVTYRPVLTLYNGDIRPLIRIYSNLRGMDRMVEEVNGWLRR
ncbi:hypothetical protein [Aliiroseovarius crassostreae]|uniref:hypothetical protein n=1 Tax=Aliiroseovarius crassostreae TaxID=154981 RepID=UPI003C7EC534